MKRKIPHSKVNIARYVHVHFRLANHHHVALLSAVLQLVLLESWPEVSKVPTFCAVKFRFFPLCYFCCE